ncbi:Hint domain-containing protein [Paracoccus aminophilus]|nr:Hint domain-containing protein [Paracoccus aminophilus]
MSNDLFDLTLHDGDDNGRLDFEDPEGQRSPDYAVFGDAQHYLLTGVVYRATVTYPDGTTATDVPVRIFQSIYTGHLVLVPPGADASAEEIAALTQKPIQSITLTSIIDDNLSYMDVGGYQKPGAPHFICFCRGTLIRTARGEIAVENLRPGDMILTADRGYQPLRWIGSKALSAELLSVFPTLRPVRIAAGALGQNLPARDLYVSRQHRVLISSKIAGRLFGETEILVAAKSLTELDGIDLIEPTDGVEYFHLLFDQHEVIFSEGARTESLYTGDEALKAVDPAARAEIIALFPELIEARRTSAPVRPIITGKALRSLTRRHREKSRALQA